MLGLQHAQREAYNDAGGKAGEASRSGMLSVGFGAQGLKFERHTCSCSSCV